MATRLFGSGIRRREDPRLITGSATYTDDLTLPGMVHAAMLRSPHAHATVGTIDISRAQASPGVLAVYTGKDTSDGLQPMPCAWLVPDADLKVATYPCIATDTVRYVGDIVAVVVAEDPYQAYDALDLIDVEYTALPAVTNPAEAAGDGAPQVHADVDKNQAFHWAVSGGDVDAAFKDAEVVVKERIIQGADFSSSLAREEDMPRLVVRMVAVGESSGRLPTVMDKVSDAYEDQVEGSIMTATSLFEPLIICVFGAVILVLVLAIYLPVFSMSSGIN